MTRVDIPADLNSEDETALWTSSMSVIVGIQLGSGGRWLSVDASGVRWSTSSRRLSETVVHLRVLPGTIDQYRRLLSRRRPSVSAVTTKPTRGPLRC
jgi:hypothetical protein